MEVIKKEVKSKNGESLLDCLEREVNEERNPKMLIVKTAEQSILDSMKKPMTEEDKKWYKEDKKRFGY